MSEETITEVDNPLNDVISGPGIRLRKAREAAGLSQDDVAKSLYLTVTHVHSLENDDYQDTPGLIFERGYIRAYARLVNLSEESLIEDFNRLGLEDRVSSMHTYRAKAYSSKSKQLRWLMYLMVLAFSLFVITWWQMQTSTSRVINPDRNPAVVKLDPANDTLKPEIVTTPTEHSGKVGKANKS